MSQAAADDIPTSEDSEEKSERRDSSARRLSLVHERLMSRTRNIKGDRLHHLVIMSSIVTIVHTAL